MATAGLYIIRFLGQAGFGDGVLYIGHGLISGADTNGVIYDGSYQEADGGLKAEAVLSMPAAGQLVTGTAMSVGQKIAIAADLSADFANGEPQQVTVEGRTVTVTFHKIRDLP